MPVELGISLPSCYNSISVAHRPDLVQRGLCRRAPGAAAFVGESAIPAEHTQRYRKYALK